VNSNLAKSSWWITVPLAGVMVAYIFLLFLPGWKSVEECRRQIVAKKEYISQGSGLAAALQACQQELDKAQAYNAQQRQRAPQASQLPQVFEKITDQAKLAGAATTLFNPEPVDKHELLWRVPLGMRLSGTSGQIYEFLRRLDEMTAPIWVDRLRMAVSSKNGEAMQAEVSMVVFVDNSENSDYIKPAGGPIK
jgi:Tfp pilus assembly protein PilO